jgi:phage terminase large subunit-like protein
MIIDTHIDEYKPYALPTDETAIANGCYYNHKLAVAKSKFFTKFLRHSKGEWAGKPFELLAWQLERVIYPLFGWMRPDGTRRFRKMGIWCAKKNGKSALASGLQAYFAFADGEMGAEVYVAASDKNQASIVFDETANMIEASPELAERSEIIRSRKLVVIPATKSTIKALSADVATKEGLNISALIFDELHAQKTRTMWDTLTYGGVARRQPIQISISTAGWDLDTIGYEQYSYACQVRDGIINDWEFLPVIFEATKEDDWKSPATWAKANPSLGTTIDEEGLRSDCMEAEHSPAKLNSFRRYRCNQWTEQDAAWITADAWKACASKLDENDLIGRTCYGAFDLSSTQDTTSFVLLFPDDDNEGCTILPWFWLPNNNLLEKELKSNAKYTEWKSAGLLKTTPGDVIDYKFIKNHILECAKKYNIKEIAYDPFLAMETALDLQAEGLNMQLFRQGFTSMGEPSLKFEKFVLQKKLHHGNHALMNWQVANAVVEMDAAGLIKPDKSQRKRKIDGVVATVMCIGLWLRTNRNATSIYESRGLITL